MSKAYLVSYSEGSYEDVSYNNVFITFDEQKAIDYVNKFNRILLKWRKIFNDKSRNYAYYDTIIEEIILFREVNQAIYKEIEVR